MAAMSIIAPSPTNKPPLPKDRSFGLLLAAMLLLGGFYAGYKQVPPLALSSFIASAAILAISLFAPARLAGLNRAWFALGLLLGRIVNPVVLGLIYFVLLTPLALILRWMGRDTLGLRSAVRPSSYWLERDGSASPVDAFKTQF